MLGLKGDDVFAISRLCSEPSDALDGHVVRFGGSRGEDDVLWIRIDEPRDVSPRFFDSLFRFPAVSVRPRVRIAELIGKVGHHGIEDARIDGRGGLRTSHSTCYGI